MDAFLNTYPDSTIYYGKVALEIAPENQDADKHAQLLKTIGSAYLQKADYHKALTYYHKALGYCRTGGNIQQEIEVMNSIGVIYEITRDYDYALQSFTQAIRLWDSVYAIYPPGDEALRSIIYLQNNTGLVYDFLGRHEEAMKHYQSALKSGIELTDSVSIASTLLNIGMTYNELEEYDVAIEHLSRSKSIAESIQNETIIANSCIALGLTLMKIEDLDNAEAYLLRGYETARKISANRLVKEASSGLAMLYNEKGNFQRALFFQKTYQALKDTIFGFRTIAAIERQKDDSLLLRFSEFLPQEKHPVLNTNLRDFSGLITFILGLLLSYVVIMIVRDFKDQEEASRVLMKKLSDNHGLNNQEHHPGNTDDENKMAEMLQSETKKKYASSGLTDSRKQELIDTLGQIMKTRKPYLESTFTISTLALMAGTGRTYLSQTINEYYQKSFTQWINEYRVEEAIALMKSIKSEKFSIEAISEMAGFSSKSSFYMAFKTVTGTTPAEFLKNQST